MVSSDTVLLPIILVGGIAFALLTVYHWDFIQTCEHMKQWRKQPSQYQKTNSTIYSLSSQIQHHYEIIIDVKKEIVNLNHFWKSTGFCPPDPHQAAAAWLLSGDVHQSLRHAASAPHAALTQVRVHWLLDVVSVSRFSARRPVYDFSRLDALVDRLRHLGLTPGFELMGNPSALFTDFENATQVFWWRDLVHRLASHFIDRYGLEYVATWNFESWNEPKRKHFDSLNVTIQGFLNYYDACWSGLKRASGRLRLGGPAGECRLPYRPDNYCWALLDHVGRGRDFFTHRRHNGTGIDFISIHKKGESPDNTMAMMRKEDDFLRQLQRRVPSLTAAPVFNDEADPLVGWSKPQWWRADATYAALVAKIVVKHQERFARSAARNSRVKPIYELLSNDNAFLSYRPHFFMQRTLLARFQINATRPPHTHFVRKPVLSMLGLLALLGDRQIGGAVVAGASDRLIEERDVGVLATVHHPPLYSLRDSWQLCVLVYCSRDTHNVSGRGRVKVVLRNLENGSGNSGDIRYMLYSIDNLHGNPFSVWKRWGKPDTPSPWLLQQMRDEQEVPSEGPFPLTAALWWSVSLPAVRLLHACARPPMPPTEVRRLEVVSIADQQVLVTWSDRHLRSKCVVTYEVEYRRSTDGPFVRVNLRNTIFTSFVYVPRKNKNKNHQTPRVEGFYRVRAIDYWLRPSPYSDTVPYPLPVW